MTAAGEVAAEGGVAAGAGVVDTVDRGAADTDAARVAAVRGMAAAEATSRRMAAGRSGRTTVSIIRGGSR
jgi:hypothetical protein